jgi:WD40 repeat protein
MSWLPAHAHSLAIGSGAKWLRLYDVRGKKPTLSVLTGHAKRVGGVQFDPFCPNRLATCSAAEGKFSKRYLYVLMFVARR